jgi:RimJ/RimL family protein N-acetyltransferase
MLTSPAGGPAILAAPMFGPVLGGKEVTLRPGRDDDAEHFVRWFADTDVTRYLARRMAVALYQEQEYLKKIGESKDDVWWMIDAAGRPIGATGIHGINWLDANGATGIVIGEKDCWGKGYATEAMRLRTRYAFRELNLHKLTTEVDADNVASRRALEKNGYRGVGLRREQIFRDGRWHDRWMGEVLRDEWERDNPG